MSVYNLPYFFGKIQHFFVCLLKTESLKYLTKICFYYSFIFTKIWRIKTSAFEFFFLLAKSVFPCGDFAKVTVTFFYKISTKKSSLLYNPFVKEYSP